MIISIPKEITLKKPEIFDFIQSKSLWSLVMYKIKSNDTRVTSLQSWFDDIVLNPCLELIEVANSIPDNKDYDYVMTDILRWVKDNIKYIPDNLQWKLPEYWQTPQETLTLRKGDCEDGALLICALARYKGVPSNRVVIFAGDVYDATSITKKGGHCWCGYRATEYPLNWCFMDWCYWYDGTTPSTRPKYYIQINTIYDDALNRYKTIWFAFNDKIGHHSLLNSI